MQANTKPTRDEQRERDHDHTGKCAFDAIKEMVDNLMDWEKAAADEGWTGPHKDQFGATYFETAADEDGKGATWACADWRELCLAHDIEPDERSEDGERTIHEDPLSVLVRDGWREPGRVDDGGNPEEYEILLSTGGPATRIVGKLNEHNEPATAALEVQDWFVPWKEWRGEGWDEDTLLTYACCFYFGE